MAKVGKAKVRQDQSIIGGSKHEVFGFYVSVCDVKFVAVINGRNDLKEKIEANVFWQPGRKGFEMFEKLNAWDQF